MKKTTFELWQSGNDYGSFYNTLFRAYQIADRENKTKLRNAFPELFTLDFAS